MGFRLQLRNYKTHRAFDWSPAGVCALVGPNGGGKTTALWTMEFLRIALESDINHAIEFMGGGAVRNYDAPAAEPCEIVVSVGDVSWVLRPTQGDVRDERVIFRGNQIFPKPTTPLLSFQTGTIGFPETTHPSRLGLQKVLVAGGESAKPVSPLLSLVTNYSIHGDYTLRTLRESGSQSSSDLSVSHDGSNVFAVLRNWRDKVAHRHRWEFVESKLSVSFPTFFRALDFEAAGNVVNATVITPKGHQVRSADWASGFFATLIHLAGIGSTNPGNVIAIDEPETSLHPALIRWLIGEFREWSAEHDVTVLLATHSPVVIDCFKDCPEQLFVLEPGQPTQPIALDKLKPSEWLSMFELGDLYSKAKMGAPENFPAP